MTTTTSPKFSGLSIADAEVPATRTVPADNPFYPAMVASRDAVPAEKRLDSWKGQGKAVKVTGAQAPDAERLIRQAGEALKVGSMIRFRTDDGKLASIESVGGKVVKGTNGGKDRKTGGKPTLMVDGKAFTGTVTCYFSAKAPRKVKPSAK